MVPLAPSRSQQKFKGLPDYGLGFELIDFSQIAKTIGLNGVSVEAPEDFAKALSVAMTANKTTVIDARVDPEAYQDSFIATTGMLPQ